LQAAVAAKPYVRLLVLGGVIGPVAFVGAWLLGSAITENYSAVDDAISDLAAVGAPNRAVMTVGFVVFGCGLIAFGFALRALLDGGAWIAAVVTGVSTIAVAATPLGGWSGDGVHAAFAGVGYVSLVGLPLLAARPMAGGVGLRPAVSRTMAAISAACLAASTLGPAHGLWQRLGLTVTDAWIVLTALGLLGAIGAAGVGRADRDQR
jgi:hypothetical protein